MRIVDKYELAKCPNGTPFYKLNIIKNEEENFEDGGFCEQALMILDGFRWINDDDGKEMFNGVTYLEINNKNDECFGGSYFKSDNLPKEISLVNIDTDSNDYNDEDRFLVLSSKEFSEIIKTLSNYCDLLGVYEDIENKKGETDGRI